MDITFSCTYCGRRLEVDESGAGLIVPCPKCGKQVKIPAPFSEPDVAPPRSSSFKASAPAASETKKCPFCAETIKAEAKVCRFCGRDLVTAISPRISSTTASGYAGPRPSPAAVAEPVFRHKLGGAMKSQMQLLALLFFLGGPGVGGWIYWSADQKAKLAAEQRHWAFERSKQRMADAYVSGGTEAFSDASREFRSYIEAQERAETDRKSSMYLAIGIGVTGVIVGAFCQSAASKQS